MKLLSRNETAEFLRTRDYYCILTHRKPDGDTLGSAAALCRGLRALGKQAWILKNPDATARYDRYLDGLICEDCGDDMTVVSVDVAAENMLAPGFEKLLGRIALKIDHHGIGGSFAGMGLVDPESAACGEIIYDLLVLLGVELDQPTAEAIYVAASTDTGCFQYSNTTAGTLRTAAACLEAGIDAYEINRVFFETKRLARLKLEAYMVQNMELFANGTIALCRIPLEVERELGINEDDTQNLSNFIRNIEGVRMGITFRTDKDGSTKLSARSIPGYDVAKVCAELGGGGHAAAAGGRVRATQEEAREKVLAVLREQGYIANI